MAERRTSQHALKPAWILGFAFFSFRMCPRICPLVALVARFSNGLAAPARAGCSAARSMLPVCNLSTPGRCAWCRSAPAVRRVCRQGGTPPPPKPAHVIKRLTGRFPGRGSQSSQAPLPLITSAPNRSFSGVFGRDSSAILRALDVFQRGQRGQTSETHVTHCHH